MPGRSFRAGPALIVIVVAAIGPISWVLAAAPVPPVPAGPPVAAVIVNPLPVPAAVVSGISPAMIAAFATAAIAIIGALVTGVIKITAALRDTKRIVVTGQVAAAAVGVLRDQKIQEIHLLVNSRLLTVLRLLVTVTKKEFDRTGTESDRVMYEQALGELTKAEASALTVEQVQSQVSDDNRATAAQAQLDAATARAGKPLPTVQEQLILTLQTLVSMTRRDAERTKSPGDLLIHQQAVADLARAQAAAR